MSLINDALKKAARQRAADSGELLPPMPGGGHRRVSRQGEPMRRQTVVLIVVAAVALIVVSAVITGIFVSAKPEPKAVIAAAPVAVIPTPVPLQKIIVQALPQPVSTPLTAVPTPSPLPVVVAKAVAPAPAPTPAPALVEPTPDSAIAAEVATPGPMTHTEKIQAMIDKFRVSGVRAVGADSKALVDGHVYKLNDIIDRRLGLKMVKVDDDHLTFVDADGATYIKTF